MDISRRRGTRKVIRNEDMADQKKLRVSLGLQANDIHEEEKFQERFMAFIGDLNSRKQDGDENLAHISRVKRRIVSWDVCGIACSVKCKYTWMKVSKYQVDCYYYKKQQMY